jgi:hypothetical protein
VRERGEASRASLLPEYEVDDPAPADVRPRTAAVVEDLGAVAAGVLKGVGEKWGG